ncbi:phage protein [Klebsiella pneumoniae]|uniref:phage protein n=1 Tax=Klebsiella pneumoniae TaxID=573 RepID=UPI00058962C3|nr:phage protein [Klebsiella pneumoniae]
MRQECINAVQQAASRRLTQQEIKNIEDRIYRNMRQLARNDPASWRAMTDAERLRRAGQLAANELTNEAALKKRRVALTIAARQRLDAFIKTYQGKDGKLEALNRTIAFHADGKSNFLSVESRGKATRDYALSQIQEAFEAVDPRFFHLFEDEASVRDLVYEMRGQDTGNVRAKKGAKAWAGVTELLRQRFNDAGGDIGYLENWGIPQHHSMEKVGRVPQDKWVSDVIGKLDRKYYIKDDGQLMSDAELKTFLGEAYNTIATGGLNKLSDTGMRISGARSNRGNASRQIHFKDADSYLQYQREYGDRSLWEVMVGHLEGISKDIALVETYGPNPDHVFRSILDEVTAEQATANPERTGRIKRLANSTENLYNFIAGKTQPIANPHIARWSDNIRNWMVASRLGSALLASFSDLGTMYMSAKVANIPMNRLFMNQLEAMNPANRTELARARRAGLAMESLLGSVNRWAMDNMGPSVSRWAATAVMRASGLTAWTDAHKRAYGVTMMGSLGEVVSRAPDLRSLDDSDFRILKSKGITEQDFSVWKLAQQEDWGNGNTTMLTPESIMRIPDAAVMHLGLPERVRFEAMRRLLAAVSEEVDMAVITPGAREQLLTGGGLQRGTWKGELTRSVFLFKSFPISVVLRHWTRAMGMPSAGGRAAYIAAFLASTTMLGALSQQLNDLASGRNPREMTGKDAGKFWLGALLKGGGLGLYGDFLLSDHTRYGGGALASMLGPVAGLVDDVVKLAQGIPLNAVEGKPEQTGGDLVKLGKGLIPGANLWYAKAALDHMIFNQLQEYFSPGYLRKMEQRSKKEFNQTYWWRPQDVTPE